MTVSMKTKSLRVLSAAVGLAVVGLAAPLAAQAGATGNIGREIARQALARGHQVTAIVRRETDLPAELDGAQLAVAALDDTDALAAVIAGHDVLASAFGPRPGDAGVG